MCPEFEELERSPHTFETTKFGQRIFIKQYGRSAADKIVNAPEKVRPPVLIKLVVDYLKDVIID